MKINAMVDGVEREVELTNYQAYVAYHDIQHRKGGAYAESERDIDPAQGG